MARRGVRAPPSTRTKAASDTSSWPPQPQSWLSSSTCSTRSFTRPAGDRHGHIASCRSRAAGARTVPGCRTTKTSGSRTEPSRKDSPAEGTIGPRRGKRGAVGSCLSALASPVPAGTAAWLARGRAKAQPGTRIPSALPRPGCLLGAGLAPRLLAAQEGTVPLPRGTPPVSAHSWERAVPCPEAAARTGCPDTVHGAAARAAALLQEPHVLQSWHEMCAPGHSCPLCWDGMGSSPRAYELPCSLGELSSTQAALGEPGRRRWDTCGKHGPAGAAPACVQGGLGLCSVPRRGAGGSTSVLRALCCGRGAGPGLAGRTQAAGGRCLAAVLAASLSCVLGGC